MRLVLLGHRVLGKVPRRRGLPVVLPFRNYRPGNMLAREAVASGVGPSGHASKVSWKRGDLVPDDVVIAVVADRMDHSDAASGFYPRRLSPDRGASGGPLIGNWAGQGKSH